MVKPSKSPKQRRFRELPRYHYSTIHPWIQQRRLVDRSARPILENLCRCQYSLHHLHCFGECGFTALLHQLFAQIVHRKYREFVYLVVHRIGRSFADSDRSPFRSLGQHSITRCLDELLERGIFFGVADGRISLGAASCSDWSIGHVSDRHHPLPTFCRRLIVRTCSPIA